MVSCGVGVVAGGVGAGFVCGDVGGESGSLAAVLAAGAVLEGCMDIFALTHALAAAMYASVFCS